MARITKKLSRLLAQAGTHTRGLLRIIAHMPAPLSLKLNVRSLSNADCQGKSRPLNQSVRLDMSHYISLGADIAIQPQFLLLSVVLP